MKITIVGGGSPNWMRGILKDIMLCDELNGSHIVLHDLHREDTLLAQQLAWRYNALLGKDFNVTLDETLESAVGGADFVIFTFSPGSLDAYWHDLEIPTKYGIHQPVSMTVGPSGISASLRTVPVAYEMAETIARVAPGAWLLNLTNPMVAVTRAVNMALPTGRAIGLCHGLFDAEPMLCAFYGVPWERIAVEVGGINHFIWITRLWVDGVDRYDELRAYAATHDDFAAFHAAKPSNRIATNPFANTGGAQALLLRRFGLFPCNNDRHTVEFFPWLSNHQAQWGARYGVKKTTVAYRKARRAEQRQWMRDVVDGKVTPDLTQTREEFSDIMRAVVNNRPGRFIMNLPNRGQIRNLPPDGIVETLGVADAGRAYGLAIGDLPESIAALCRLHLQVAELTVQAALHGDRRALLEALYLDPLAAQADAREIPKMADELLAANRAYLPRFG